MVKYLLVLSMFFATSVFAGGAGGSWGEPTQHTKPAPTNDTGDYTGGGGKFGGTGAGGSWGDDYSGGGGKFGGSGAGGSWNSSSSSSSSGASCTNDGWKFDYIVNKDKKSFESLEQACRHVWSKEFLKKYGYKETRMSSGKMRGKYYRKIDVINDWSADCDIHVGYAGSNYENNIGGIGIFSFSVNKYYKGKVEICEPETMPPIPNFPMPPAPNTPTPNTPSGGGGSTGTGGGNGTGGNTNNYNYTTNNYKWDITTNNHNTTNNTNHITNNHGISDDKINQLIIAIKNQNSNIDLSPIINAINTVNQSINNLSFEQIKSIEVDLTAVINAINANKYDDTQLQAKLNELAQQIVQTNAKLDKIIDILNRPQQCSTNPFNKKICDFIDWFQGGIPPLDDNSAVSVDDGSHFDWQSIAQNNYLTLPSSCPFNPLFNVPFLGKAASIVFPMDIVCRGAVMLKVLILLWASFTSLRIIGDTPL